MATARPWLYAEQDAAGNQVFVGPVDCPVDRPRKRGRRKARPDPEAVLGPLEAGRRTTDPATRKRIAELAAQVAKGEYHPVERMREVFGMSEPRGTKR